MYEVTNVGTYDDNHRLYEVTRKTRQGTNNYVKKSTYIVNNNDAEKFELLYQKENKLYDELKILDTPEHKKKASHKLKFAVALGTIIGAGIPLSIFAFTKNKYARIAAAIISAIGGIVGILSGIVLTAVGNIPKEIRREIINNQKEFVKLDTKIIKKNQEITTSDYKK